MSLAPPLLSTSLPGQSDYNRMVSEFRNSWTPREQEGGLNGSTSVSVGGNDPVFGQRIGYLVSGTYSYAQEARVDQRRALALATTGAEATEVDRFSGNTGKSSVLWGGMANFSTLLGDRTRLALNNTYNRTMDSEARNETGFSENLGIPFNISRLKYVERSVRDPAFLQRLDQRFLVHRCAAAGIDDDGYAAAMDQRLGQGCDEMRAVAQFRIGNDKANQPACSCQKTPRQIVDLIAELLGGSHDLFAFLGRNTGTGCERPRDGRAGHASLSCHLDGTDIVLGFLR